MKKILILVIPLLAFVQSAFCGELKLDIPKAIWEPIFFESINELTSLAGWVPLRKEILPEDSLELRLWFIGRMPVSGYRFRRDGAVWSGNYVGFDFDNSASGSDRATSFKVKPRSGWTEFWNKMTGLGVLTLPDASTLPGEVKVFDGKHYVFEISTGGTYRTYEYGNPQLQKWPEAKKILEMMELFDAEFVEKDGSKPAQSN